jgi:hypothetical protein
VQRSKNHCGIVVIPCRHYCASCLGRSVDPKGAEDVVRGPNTDEKATTISIDDNEQNWAVGKEDSGFRGQNSNYQQVRESWIRRSRNKDTKDYNANEAIQRSPTAVISDAFVWSVSAQWASTRLVCEELYNLLCQTGRESWDSARLLRYKSTQNYPRSHLTPKPNDSCGTLDATCEPRQLDDCLNSSLQFPNRERRPSERGWI